MSTARQPLRGVREIETEWIVMPDGARLAARIWRPVDAEVDPVPAVLEFLPYRRRDFTRLRGDQEHRYIAARGYAGVRVDLRGSGDSDGVLHDEYLQRELDDAVAIIHWLAAQPWCSGNVGMTGISWGGFNALQVAALRPAPLKAIAPACFTDDRYADDIHTMGGCLLTDNLMWSSTMFGFNSRPPDPAVVGDRWRDMWLERLEAERPWLDTWLRHQTRDEYWRHGSVCEDYSAIRCAVYAIGGWADGYSNAVPRLLAGLDCPKKGLIGPWPHAWPQSGKPGPTIGWLDEVLRWWDQWLKGIDTGVMDEPVLRVWMQDSAAPADRYDERPGRWVAERRWPPGQRPMGIFHLTGTGLVSAGLADVPDTSAHGPIAGHSLTQDPVAGEPVAAEPALNIEHHSHLDTGLAGGEWCPYGYPGDLPVDQREDDERSLVFDTPVLEETLEFFGAPAIELTLSVNRPVAMLAARLCDVAPDGASTLITHGLLNLTHDAAHAHVTRLETDQPLRVRVTLNDIAQQVPAGHRLRLALSTSYWPRAWPSPEPVTVTLRGHDNRLLLPVRDPQPEDHALPAFGPAQTAPSGAHSILRAATRERHVEHDAGSGTTVVTSFKDRGRIRLEEADLTIDGGSTDTFAMTAGNPLSARHSSVYRIAMERNDWRVNTTCTTTLTCDAGAFHLSASIEAREGDVLVFSRDFESHIARNGI